MSMNEFSDVDLEKISPKETEEGELPVYYEQLKLKESDKERILDEIVVELEAIRDERNSIKLDSKIVALRNQYKGEVTEDERRMFNLSRQTTRTKVNKVSSLLMQAFMDSDPKFSVTPRPENEDPNADAACEKKTDFLDYKLDNLPYRDPSGMVVHNGVLIGTGIKKIRHIIKREDRRREEVYRPQDLEAFLKNWPTAEKDYPQYIKTLQSGKELRIMAKFKETTYNDPGFFSVEPENFFVRIGCDGYEGLCTTKLTAEKIPMLYWDLKREEERGMFYDIDDLTYTDKEKKARIDKAENRYYDILECVFYTKLKESDEEFTKCVFWINEEKRKMIGSILYPLYAVDCYYNPFYIMRKTSDFYGIGLGEVLTDLSLAEDAMLNAILESVWMQNLITPITQKNSQVAKQFTSKRWTHGVPLTLEQGETVDFLQKYMAAPNVPGMVSLMQFMLQAQDDASGVTSLMSGRESPLDPSAPASKTLALLQQSGINIKEYIQTMAPAFNRDGEILFAMYYQMNEDGVRYRVSPDREGEEGPFSTLTRQDIMSKSNIQTMALAFDFDQLNSQKVDLALYQTLRLEPLFAADPNQVYFALKTIIKGFSPKWRRLYSQLIGKPEDLQKKSVKQAMQTTAQYIQMKIMESRTTGVPPEFNVEELAGMIAQGQKLLGTPPTKEEVKEAQKKNA